MLIVVVAGTVLIGFQCRKTAAWCLILLGGSLLLWQACEARKWTIVHEEVFAILRYAGNTRDETGQSPADLEGYTFNTEWVRPHIYRFEPENQDGFKLIYFMDDPGITYWYSSGSGFGYYPD